MPLSILGSKKLVFNIIVSYKLLGLSLRTGRQFWTLLTKTKQHLKSTPNTVIQEHKQVATYISVYCKYCEWMHPLRLSTAVY